MKRLLSLLFVILFAICLSAQDWAGFSKYAHENDSIKRAHANVQVVFLGNSITQGWRDSRPAFFREHAFVGRGINGQTTSHMLVRMRQDVLELHPQVVVILAGTNDIAKNNGDISLGEILGNLISMCELARANGIIPVLCSLVPARAFYWRPEISDAAELIRQMNEMIRLYADANGIMYVDYWSAMADENGGLPDRLSADGVHPNDAGYEIMEPIILEALRQVMK